MTQATPTPETGTPFVVSIVSGRHIGSLTVLAASRREAIQDAAAFLELAALRRKKGGALFVDSAREVACHG